MQFAELKEQVKRIGFDTLRSDTDNYFEDVIVKDKMDEIIRTLESFFGAPIWPSKNKLPPQISDIIKNFGGIAVGQILFFSRQDKDTTFAMLWPWQDGKHATIKIIHQ